MESGIAPDSQIVIYQDAPEGQLIQTTYRDYLEYWQPLGWRIYGTPPELPGINERGIKQWLTK